jgi:hypothetical protein
MSQEDLIPIGPIVRLQVQINPLKVGTKPHERYDPGNIRQVPLLEIGPHGVIGLDPDREHALEDVHNRDHPLSRFRGENGVSIGFTSHYRTMRDRFGEQLADGIAGENILVACDEAILIHDIANGIVVGEGEDTVIIDDWVVARPCAPFTKFALGLSHGQKPDRRVTEGLQFLDDGTRGFYGRYHDQRPNPAVIGLGAMVYRRR